MFELDQLAILNNWFPVSLSILYIYIFFLKTSSIRQNKDLRIKARIELEPSCSSDLEKIINARALIRVNTVASFFCHPDFLSWLSGFFSCLSSFSRLISVQDNFFLKQRLSLFSYSLEKVYSISRFIFVVRREHHIS